MSLAFGRAGEGEGRSGSNIENEIIEVYKNAALRKVPLDVAKRSLSVHMSSILIR